MAIGKSATKKIRTAQSKVAKAGEKKRSFNRKVNKAASKA